MPESNEPMTLEEASKLAPPAGGPLPEGAPPMPPPIPEPRDPANDTPFVAPPPMQVAPPTDEQYAWLAAHPSYVRIGQVFGNFTDRGTLDQEGNFTPEALGSPVLDGNGNFGVGIPK